MLRRTLPAALAFALVLLIASTAWAEPVSVHSRPDRPAQVEVARVPWKQGDQVTGTVEVTVSAALKQLNLQPVANAWVLDALQGAKVIPAQNMQFALQTTSGEPATSFVPGQTYSFALTVDNIPAAGIYKVGLVATGQYADGRTFRDTSLPTLVITALPGVQATAPSGEPLVVQWTNVEAPFWMPDWLKRQVNRFLPLELHRYLFRYNPPAQIALTLPGGTEHDATRVTVSMDPVLTDKGGEAETVSFWEWSPVSTGPTGHEVQAQTRRQMSIDRFGTLDFDLKGNQTVYVELYRQYDKDGNRVTSPRIAPGTYKTKFHVKSDLGTVQDFPVEIHVKDSAVWPALVVILGVLLSFVANYLHNNHALLGALRKVRRYRRAYIRSNHELQLVNELMTEINEEVVTGNQNAVVQAAGLLEDLVLHPKDTEILNALFVKLLGVTGIDQTQARGLVVGAKSLDDAREKLEAFCEQHDNSGAKDLAKYFATRTSPDQPEVKSFKRRGFLETLSTNLETWYSELFMVWRTNAEAVKGPWYKMSLSLSAANLAMFLLVGGSVVAVQLSQTYGPNPNFGSPGDYFNLLFWGFAGDTARTKVTDLAQQFLPSNTVAALKDTGKPAAPGG